MKINIIDSTTQEPYANRAVLIQLKDEATGQVTNTLTLRSSQEGVLTIDQKFEGMQISASVNGTRSAWVEATDNAVLEVKGTDVSSTQTAGSQSSQKQTTFGAGTSTERQEQFGEINSSTTSSRKTPEKSE